MFTLEVEYLLGRSFAGEFTRRSASEWPPHPGRLFAALAAAYFENGKDGREKAALEWLESQGPPSLRAGEPGEGNTPMAFVPTNYVGDGPPVTRGKQPRFFPGQGPSDVLVHFIWTQTPTEEISKALDRLASRTAYLGKSCSLIRMRVTDTAPEPNYIPSNTGPKLLRVASAGRLEELARLYDADLRPTPGSQQPYRKVGESTATLMESQFGMMAIFRKVSGSDLPIEAALTLTDTVRQALMSHAGQSGVMTELVHGHGTESIHCAIVALPFVGSEHADGHLMGFAVILPREVSPEERRNVMRACHALEQGTIDIPKLGEWIVEAEEEATLSQTLRSSTWSRPSRIWNSVTPILLDRFPKKKGPTVEEILATSCRRIGLPEPVLIDHGPFARLKGVPPASRFRLQRPKEDRARWAIHARLMFPVPVQGPVVLGAGRYFGLGLMRPESDAKTNGRE